MARKIAVNKRKGGKRIGLREGRRGERRNGREGKGSGAPIEVFTKSAPMDDDAERNAAVFKALNNERIRTVAMLQVIPRVEGVVASCHSETADVNRRRQTT